MDPLVTALHSIQSKIPTGVRLVAVSKFKPADMIATVYGAGQRHFGENYVQELLEKAPALPDDIQWHFIGHLQSNKAKPLVAGVPNLSVVETVDSVKLANALDKACVKAGRVDPLSVLVQVNTSAEEQKGGIAPDGCVELARHITTACEHLHFQGLMTIGKLGFPAAEYFERLVACREEVAAALGVTSETLELSMGMSNDFELAIAHGTTNVRVGSSIFGARPPKAAASEAKADDPAPAGDSGGATASA